MRRRQSIARLGIALISGRGAPLMTLTTTVEPLVETDWLAEHINDPDVRVIEVDVNATAYTAGHLDGAVLWSAYKDLLQPSYRIIERDAFAALLSRSGIRPGTRVVFYGYSAALGFWMLKHSGHPEAAFLNGSRAKWVSDGRPMSTELPAVLSTTYDVTDLQEVPAMRASHRLVERAIGDPEGRLMDVRSVAEYTGERFWPSLPPEGEQRGGHVPGAVLMPIEDTWAPDGRFKSIQDLRSLFEAQGFTPDKEIITYCAVGGRASQAWFVLTYLLGYPNVRVYDGSWVEWGLLPGVPVER
jgi:thiosulfate/3-mercaptopyruvate sulfurtransferase